MYSERFIHLCVCMFGFLFGHKMNRFMHVFFSYWIGQKKSRIPRVKLLNIFEKDGIWKEGEKKSEQQRANRKDSIVDSV